MKLHHIISTKQFLSRDLLEDLFRSAAEMEARDTARTVPQVCLGKILATVFYEPSTRTRFSFETAMYKLGGNVITSESAAEFSSAKKGESLQDAMRVVSNYADAIVLRHPAEGGAKTASEVALAPVINAGDGGGEHPTQALLDLYTIQKELGKIDGLTFTFIGDLLYSRTVHSFLHLLPLFKDVRARFVSPAQLKLPDKYKAYLKEHNISFEESGDIKHAAKNADVLSVTRIQQERFASKEEYEQLKGSYVVDRAILGELKEKSIIIHPLPRVDEIAPEVDADPRAAYFRQTRNGVYVRMALLKSILG